MLANQFVKVEHKRASRPAKFEEEVASLAQFMHNLKGRMSPFYQIF
jgi:hypothetical protein